MRTDGILRVPFEMRRPRVPSRPARQASRGMDSTMRSWASSDAIRRTMRATRGRDSAPELRLRRECHALGLRYRVDARTLEGSRRRADMVFGRAMVAVFLDGCFWHGCPEHYVQPRRHGDFWSAKLAMNIRRDQEANRSLAEAGWVSYRVWEHQDPKQAAGQILELVRQRSRRRSRFPA